MQVAILILLGRKAKVQQRPANQPWTKLAEIFEVEISNPWIQFMANKEIVDENARIAAYSQ